MILINRNSNNRMNDHMCVWFVSDSLVADMTEFARRPVNCLLFNKFSSLVRNENTQPNIQKWTHWPMVVKCWWSVWLDWPFFLCRIEHHWTKGRKVWTESEWTDAELKERKNWITNFAQCLLPIYSWDANQVRLTHEKRCSSRIMKWPSQGHLNGKFVAKLIIF